jgi:hypothetical protein
MNQLQELRVHVEALSAAVEQNQKFFASIIHYVRRLHQLLIDSPGELSQHELRVVVDKVEEFFGKWRPSSAPASGVLYIPPRETDDADPIVREINRLISELVQMSEAEFKGTVREAFGPATQPSEAAEKKLTSPCVFIGHGHSHLWAHVKVFLDDELGLATVTYESESRAGESIVPILEKMLNQCNFAVLILTAEDETNEGTRRARQNVIHEAGLFQGRLGFRRAVLLVQDGVEGFSNVAGLQHIPFSGENVAQAFYELGRALKREGLT